LAKSRPSIGNFKRRTGHSPKGVRERSTDFAAVAGAGLYPARIAPRAAPQWNPVKIISRIDVTAGRATTTLTYWGLTALDAFYLEHRRCGELDAGVDDDSRVDDVHVRGERDCDEREGSDVRDARKCCLRHGHAGRPSTSRRAPVANMSTLKPVAAICLLVFVEPLLDGLAGYLLIHDGHEILGTILFSINALIVAGALFAFVPGRLRLPGGDTLAAAMVRNDINVWVGLAALVYSVVVRDWLPALILVVGVALLAIGRRRLGGAL